MIDETYSQSESDFQALHSKPTLIEISALNLFWTWITKIGKPNKLFSSNFRVQKWLYEINMHKNAKYYIMISLGENVSILP